MADRMTPKEFARTIANLVRTQLEEASAKAQELNERLEAASTNHNDQILELERKLAIAKARIVEVSAIADLRANKVVELEGRLAEISLEQSGVAIGPSSPSGPEDVKLNQAVARWGELPKEARLHTFRRLGQLRAQLEVECEFTTMKAVQVVLQLVRGASIAIQRQKDALFTSPACVHELGEVVSGAIRDFRRCKNCHVRFFMPSEGDASREG